MWGGGDEGGGGGIVTLWFSGRGGESIRDDSEGCVRRERSQGRLPSRFKRVIVLCGVAGFYSISC